jgi:hypothetical protein
MKRKLNTFIENFNKLSFGDFILFQEYKQQNYNFERKEYDYLVSSPILAIYIGWGVFDQTIGFQYILWQKDSKETYDVEINYHIEWSNYIDILGVWKYKPNWKEILFAWRKYNKNVIIQSNQIDWSE